jgi:hypothetical protein
LFRKHIGIQKSKNAEKENGVKLTPPDVIDRIGKISFPKRFFERVVPSGKSQGYGMEADAQQAIGDTNVYFVLG